MSDVERIARRAAREVQPGMVINLGIGLPTHLVRYLPADQDILIHSENGILGVAKAAEADEADPDLIDAGGMPVLVRPGAAYMDSAVSFALVRGGRLDISMLGAFEVDASGSLANWQIPGRYCPGIGGAMELAQKARRVIVLCTHTDRNGQPKIVAQCRLPLTAPRCVSRIITDRAVIDVTEGHLVLRELAEGVEPAAVTAATAAELIIPPHVGRF